MDHFNLFDSKVIQRFDFTGEYVGYVVDNSEFEETLSLKIYVPEIFGRNYNPAIKSLDTKFDLSTSHLINNDLKINTILNRQDYIYARAFVHRDQIYNDKEQFFKAYKVDIGEKVIVEFFNHNPNNCVYTDHVFLSDNEAITLGDGTRLGRPKKDANKQKNKIKINWDYDL